MMCACWVLLFWEQTCPSSLAAICWFSWRSKVSFHLSFFLSSCNLEMFQNIHCSLPESFVLSFLAVQLSGTPGCFLLLLIHILTTFWAEAGKKGLIVGREGGRLQVSSQRMHSCQQQREGLNSFVFVWEILKLTNDPVINTMVAPMQWHGTCLTLLWEGLQRFTAENGGNSVTCGDIRFLKSAAGAQQNKCILWQEESKMCVEGRPPIMGGDEGVISFITRR